MNGSFVCNTSYILFYLFNKEGSLRMSSYPMNRQSNIINTYLLYLRNSKYSPSAIVPLYYELYSTPVSITYPFVDTKYPLELKMYNRYLSPSALSVTAYLLSTNVSVI